MPSRVATMNEVEDVQDAGENVAEQRGLRWFHRIALLAAVVVFPLIWVGGLVTTTDAGMAVPDWPGTYGYNMFSYPLSTWFFGPWDLFIEHGHRLLASLAGLICIALFAVSFATDSRTLKFFSGLALVLVILQGVLGGTRVLLDARFVALVHGCLGPAFFAVVVFLVVASSRWWLQVGRRSWWTNNSQSLPLNEADSSRLGAIWEKLWTARSVAAITVVLAYSQLVLGANLRHIPEYADPAQYRVLVWFHVLMALAVVVGSVLLLTRPVGPVPGLRASRWFLVSVVGLQLVLGLCTWIVKFGWPEWFDGYLLAEHFRIQDKEFTQVTLVTAHVAVGSLILATSVWAASKLWRAEYCAGELLGKHGAGNWEKASKRHLPLYHAG